MYNTILTKEMTIPVDYSDYGSTSDVEAGIDVNHDDAENEHVAENEHEERNIRNALLDYCDNAPLDSLPYELRTSRDKLFVMSTIGACLFLICACGLLFIESDYGNISAKGVVGVMCFSLFLLALLCLIELVRLSHFFSPSGRSRHYSSCTVKKALCGMGQHENYRSAT